MLKVEETYFTILYLLYHNSIGIPDHRQLSVWKAASNAAIRSHRRQQPIIHIPIRTDQVTSFFELENLIH